MRKIIASILVSGLVLGLVALGGALVSIAAVDYTQLEVDITAGALGVTAPASLDWGAVNYSFDSQTASSTLDNVVVIDERGSEAGWTVTVAAVDWDGPEESLDYDGDGSATGQLTVNMTNATTTLVQGQDKSCLTLGSTDSFGVSTSTITFLTAAANCGEGEYDVDTIKLEQFIPGEFDAGTYNSTTTVTIT